MHALNPSLLVLSITGFGHDGEIARSLPDLIGLASPTLSVLLGQGTGGGALALFPADRTIAAQHGWLSPLPPRGSKRHRALQHRITGAWA